SQHEIDMRYADALKMADDCMTYRITVKEYAMKYGWHASFMPKPLFGENGSGMHTHQSLFSGGRNAFYDPGDQYFLSDVGKAFIAGQLKHAREICSVFAQWVNSYKRLVPGFEAPVYVAWSRRNRSALLRVPLYHPGRGRSASTCSTATSRSSARSGTTTACRSRAGSWSATCQSSEGPTPCRAPAGWSRCFPPGSRPAARSRPPAAARTRSGARAPGTSAALAAALRRRWDAAERSRAAGAGPR